MSNQELVVRDTKKRKNTNKKEIRQTEKEAKEIIEKLGTSELTDAPTATALKVKTYYEIEENPKESYYVYYIDIDNVKVANLLVGEKQTDNYIAELIKKYNEKITVGKDDKSDELFGIAKGISEEEAIEMKNILSSMEVEMSETGEKLGSSIGIQRVENSLQEALKIAEEKMEEDKKQRKEKQRKDISQNKDVKENIKELYKLLLDKVRIEVKRLDDLEKKELEQNILGKKGSFTESIEVPQKKLEKFYKDLEEMQEDKVEDKTFARIYEYERQFEEYYQDKEVTQEQKEEFVLAKILKDNPALGVSQKYADTIIAEKLLNQKLVVKYANLRDQTLITVGITKIKVLNDLYKSHARCDEEIKKTLESIQNVFMENGVKPGFIIGNGVSEFHFMIKGISQTKKQEIIEQISNLDTELIIAASGKEVIKNKRESKAIRSSKFGKRKPVKLFNNLINRAENKNSMVVKEKQDVQKVRDIDVIEYYKRQIFKDFMKSNVFKEYVEQRGITEEELLKECIEELFFQEEVKKEQIKYQKQKKVLPHQKKEKERE